MRNVWKVLANIALGAFLLVLPWLLPSVYLVHLLNLSGIYIILSTGLNFVSGLVGQVSFAQASFFGIGAYVSGLLAVRAGLPFWITLPAAAVVAGLFGVLMGFPSIKLEGRYLVLASIGFCYVVMLVLLNYKELTFGADGVRNIPPPAMAGVKIAGDYRYYYLILLAVVLSVVAAKRIRASRIGRALQAIKLNSLAAEAMGVPTVRMKLIAFILSAIYGGVGGSLYAHMQGYVQPIQFGFPEAVKIMTMVVVGGLGSYWGPVIGSIVLTFLPEFLRFIKSYYMAVYALTLILFVLFLPDGLYGIAVGLGRAAGKSAAPSGTRVPERG